MQHLGIEIDSLGVGELQLLGQVGQLVVVVFLDELFARLGVAVFRHAARQLAQLQRQSADLRNNPCII